jgi:hypothetical protein
MLYRYIFEEFCAKIFYQVSVVMEAIICIFKEFSILL